MSKVFSAGIFRYFNHMYFFCRRVDLKKTAVVLFFIFLFVYLRGGSARAFGASGPARAAAMGGVTIALPNGPGLVGLYADGFISSAPFIYKKSMVYISWGFVPHDIGSGINVHEQVFTVNPENSGGAGVVLKLTDKSVLIITPVISYETGEEKNISGDFTNFSFLKQNKGFGGGGAWYAFEANEKLSLGAGARYIYIYEKSDFSGSEYINYNDIQRNYTEKRVFSKMDYLVSGTYTYDENFKAALSFGSKKNINPYFQGWIKDMDFYSENDMPESPEDILYNRYAKKETTEDVIRDFSSEKKINTEESVSPYGYDINAGAEYIKKGVVEFSVSAGASVGEGVIYSRVSSTAVDNFSGPDSETKEDTGGLEMVKNGGARMVGLKGRVYFGNSSAGAFFSYKSFAGGVVKTGGAQPDEMSGAVLDARCGFCFKDGNFTAPVELFRKDYFFENRKSSGEIIRPGLWVSGIRAGAEYETEKGIFMRMGADFSEGNEEEEYLSRNPVYGRMGISMGAGRADDNFELNLLLKYTALFKISPANEDYTESAFSVFSGIKVFLD